MFATRLQFLSLQRTVVLKILPQPFNVYITKGIFFSYSLRYTEEKCHKDSSHITTWIIFIVVLCDKPTQSRAELWNGKKMLCAFQRFVQNLNLWRNCWHPHLRLNLSSGQLLIKSSLYGRLATNMLKENHTKSLINVWYQPCWVYSKHAKEGSLARWAQNCTFSPTCKIKHGSGSIVLWYVFFSKKSESTYKYLEVGWTRNLVKTCKRLKTRVGKWSMQHQ